MKRYTFLFAALSLLLSACFQAPAPTGPLEPETRVRSDYVSLTRDRCDNVGTITIGGSFNLFGVMYVDVVLLPGATINGVGEDAYIACSVTHVVDNTTASLFFPIGDEGGYRPVELSLEQTTPAETRYTAQVYREAAPYENQLEPPIKRVSNVRYWEVFKEDGGADLVRANVTLPYGQDDGVRHPPTLVLAQYNSAWGAWRSLRGRATGAPSGTLSSQADITTLSPENLFTIGDVSAGRGQASNPLE